MSNRVYISGPISGHEREEYMGRFAKAQELLEKDGYKVLNPTRKLPSKWPWLYGKLGYKLTLLYDLWLLMHCNYIYKMPGWKESRGANIESCVAYQFRVFTLPYAVRQEYDKKIVKWVEKWKHIHSGIPSPVHTLSRKKEDDQKADVKGRQTKREQAMKPFPGEAVRVPFSNGRKITGKKMKVIFNEEQQEWLKKWYPVTENGKLAKACGISKTTLYRIAKELNLKKSKAGMKRILHRTAARIKKICEKNGYYDSIRGRKPCAACMEGTQKMWQEIREGKREHPFKLLKRKDPQRYDEFRLKVSRKRRELLKRDKARLIFGLPKKTRLHTPLKPYTKSQICHRCNALKKGYILADDCREGSGSRYVIYYDDNTKRRPRLEANLIKDGFRIEKWIYD